MAPNFPHHIQGMVLRALGITPPAFPYGAITLFGGPFQGTSGRRAGVDPRPITPHLHEVIPHGFGLGSSPFPRRYSGNPILVSSPPPTWMFPFGGFPIPGQSPGSEAEAEASTPRRSHSEIPGSKPACGYPGLFAACHVLPRRPSRGIHRPASSGLGFIVRRGIHPRRTIPSPSGDWEWRAEGVRHKGLRPYTPTPSNPSSTGALVEGRGPLPGHIALDWPPDLGSGFGLRCFQPLSAGARVPGVPL